MLNSDRVQFANTLRGVAAMSVLIYHYLGVFWLKRDVVGGLVLAPVLTNEVATPTIVGWLNVVDLGAYGVALFFLVSGFVIPFSVAASTTRGFAVNRLFRIYPLYMVGFTITLGAVWASAAYFKTAWPYGGWGVLVHYFPGVHLLVWAPTIDGIIWTLNIEVFFYVLCAAMAPLLNLGSKKVFLVPGALFVIATILTLALPSLSGVSSFWYVRAVSIVFLSPFLIFMFVGVALNYTYSLRINLRISSTIVVSLLIMQLLLLALGPYQAILYQWPIYIVATGTFLAAMRVPKLFRSGGLSNFLADISYPLYVVHGVAGYAAIRVLLEMGVTWWKAVPLVASGVLLVSWVLHRWIEVPSQQLGKQLSRRLDLHGVRLGLNWRANTIR